MKPLRALFAAAAASAFALAATDVLAVVLRKKAVALSREQRTLYAPPLELAGVPRGELAARGEKLYFNSCAHCHGADARGDEGPDLHDLWVSDRRIAAVIKHGIKGEMPSFAKKHTDVEVAELIAYLRTLE